ncbi:hypothetical protein [Phaeodactylibacter luteus]|uniref:Uncharacterized protein n=1 Tax=Phaeodactylibacter luteus TaxID=1564516 RepID=A0A5C6RKP0_9BACT|nr:hypothetical protein [Phaeodactylibacter luteus]TXB62916.1 hypothetical protein FRY97_11265 [Phaeodactylibacter luteus]
MPTQNEALIALLQDAHTTCQNHLSTAQETEALGADEIEAARSELASVFRDFSEPALWVQEAAYDKTALLHKLIALKRAAEGPTTPFLEHMDKLIRYLREELLSAIQDNLQATDTSAWNLKMLDELLKIRRVLRDTKRKFIEAGHPLDTDEAFLAVQDRFTGLLADYRKLLRENAVQANEADIGIMQLLYSLIQSAATVAAFVEAYTTLNDVVAEHCSRAAPLPEPEPEEKS